MKEKEIGVKGVVTGIVGFVGFIVVVVILLSWPEAIKSKHTNSLILTWTSLKIATLDLQLDGSFTNAYPNICRIFPFTNQYSISGADYQCVVAADSWDYRNRGNLLAFTTNGDCLFIDEHGAIKLKKQNDLVGY